MYFILLLLFLLSLCLLLLTLLQPSAHTGAKSSTSSHQAFLSFPIFFSSFLVPPQSLISLTHHHQLLPGSSPIIHLSPIFFHSFLVPPQSSISLTLSCFSAPLHLLQQMSVGECCYWRTDITASPAC
ncbi:hypothetical protein BsWGS_16549 [Bradybaena similaris]